MAKVPVICNSCERFFVTESVIGGDVSNVTFVNVEVGPCPNCGGTGHIPDGTYDFIGNAIHLLSGPTRTASELQQLAEILRKAQARGTSANEVKDEVKKKLPELSRLSDLLPQTRSDLYAFITITIITLTLA